MNRVAAEAAEDWHALLRRDEGQAAPRRPGSRKPSPAAA